MLTGSCLWNTTFTFSLRFNTFSFTILIQFLLWNGFGVVWQDGAVWLAGVSVRRARLKTGEVWPMRRSYRGRSPAHPVSRLVNGVICLSRLLIGHDEALARSDWRRRGVVPQGAFKLLNSWPLTWSKCGHKVPSKRIISLKLEQNGI